MRSRTELVTTQLEGSDFDDESDFEDSEEDWQPAKGEPKPKKVGSPGRARKSGSSSKNGSAKKRTRKPAKKPKKKASSDEDEPEDDISEDEFPEPDQEPSPAKQPKKTSKKPAEIIFQSVAVPSPVTESVVKSELKFEARPEPTTSASPKPQPLQRKIVAPVKPVTDRCGFMNLFVFKGDLKDGILNNPQVCLWRRDGSSLLQKYLRDKTVDSAIPQFNSSMVYSCWEDKRADEYLELKVRCLDQTKQIRVELTNIDELEAKSTAEYDSYVTVYGVPPVRTNTKDGHNPNQAIEDDEDDDEEEDDLEDGEEGEESEDAVQEE